MDILIWILIVIFTLLVVVTIHEFGHFIVGRLSGVKIIEYSIGFGPKIFVHQGKKTRYCIRVLPLGGFVIPASEELKEIYPDEVVRDDQMIENMNYWQRMLFTYGGIIFNILFALLISLFFFLIKTNNKISYPDFLYQSFATVVKGLIGIFTNPGNIHSIGRIVEDGSKTTVGSWGTQFFSLLVAFSINLGLFNLIPMPPLDGYKSLEVTFEKITKRKIPLNVKMTISIVGVVLLIALSAFAIINDFI
ncbi:MAG: site-2 protease family protein [Mycoplasma sp.]|nr:site-2 protease family protein [Mycoplasma sp.]